MATASGETQGRRGSVMPFVAYGVVLALLGAAGGAVVLRSGPAPGPPPASVESAHPVRGLKLPPRPAVPEAEAAAAVKQEPAPSSPSQTDAGEKKPELPKTECKVDLGRWPADKTDQAQAVQVLLRHLGYYRGTTNGTVGPQTRTAIREFQLASGESETGEVSEALFESLKKKCAMSAP